MTVATDLAQLAAAATPGPWTAHPHPRGDDTVRLQLGAPPGSHWSAWIPAPRPGDLALILAAPDLARQLLATDVVARVAYAERAAAHAALDEAGVEDGREEGPPPTGHDLARRILLLAADRDRLRDGGGDRHVQAEALREAARVLDDYEATARAGDPLWPGGEESVEDWLRARAARVGEVP